MTSLLEQRIENVLETVQKPSRYIGGEANQVKKRQATSLVALCYPDAYEVGISNQALQILYAQVNRRERFAAERVYCPWPDMADAMRREGVPLPITADDPGAPIPYQPGTRGMAGTYAATSLPSTRRE